MLYTDASLAQMCNQVYSDEAEIKKLGYKFIDIKATDTQAMVKETFKYVIVCFRGTESVHDAIQDLKFKDRTKRGVHKGFSEAFSSVESEVTYHLKDSGTKEIVFCGHSLGGALAVLAYAHYAPSHNSCRCVTFGCPRVFGSEAFSDNESPAYRLAQDEIIRYSHPRDPVTYLPPCMGGYRHVGKKIKVKLLQKDPEENNWLKALFSSTLSRHSMDRYVENMEGRK